MDSSLTIITNYFNTINNGMVKFLSYFNISEYNQNNLNNNYNYHKFNDFYNEFIINNKQTYDNTIYDNKLYDYDNNTEFINTYLYFPINYINIFIGLLIFSISFIILNFKILNYKVDKVDKVNKVNKVNKVDKVDKVDRVNKDDNLDTITKSQLYLESILEINKENEINHILSKIKSNNYYFMILRVKLQNCLVKRTQEKEQEQPIKYMYMIVGIDFNNTNNKTKTDIINEQDEQIDYIIINCINFLNRVCDSGLKHEDFLVLAICGCKYNNNDNDKNNINNNNNIYYGLKNINYDINEILNVNIRINSTYSYKYILTKPDYNIYNMLLDTYNYTIFESKKYKINNKHEETWDGKTLVGN